MIHTQIHKSVSLLLLILLGFALSATEVNARSLPDFTGLVESNSDAVVNISTSGKAKARMVPHGFKIPDLPEDSPLNDFFGHFFGQPPRQSDTQPRSSLGSGFIISGDGYVITNHHVIKDADEIIVRLSDRREFKAELVGSDERSDTAVLKIEATNLPTVKLGQSSNLKVGEWVLAIGSPFGFDHSVTAGIVSAKGRSLPNESYVPFIQTDVAINPGNSGGPLFNLDGEVVGVNSQIYSRTGGFMGVSFAIPIDVVMNVYDQLRDKGQVTRGWLGVLIQDVTRELAESFDMKRPHGALVAKVLPDSPAEKAGFETGDVVIQFNKQKIERSGDLPPLVGNIRVGDRVPVKVIRNGKRQQLFVVIGQLPEQEAHQLSSPKKPELDQKLKFSVKELTKVQREKLKLSEQGVLVDMIDAGPAYDAGIRQGDILLMLNNEKIHNVEQFDQTVSHLPTGRSIPVLIQRRGNPIFMAIRVPG